MNVTRLPSRLALVGGAALSSVLLLPPAAHAHVTVQPQGQATKSGYATVNFKVPNERDGASTVKLEVTLPRDHPMASAMPQPVPGWTVEVEKAKLDTPLVVHGRKITEAPAKITWTASGSKIGPGQFQQFPVSLGRLPESADRLVFKALQTYDDKEVVRWIEEAQEGAAEPDSPAPVLELVSAVEDGAASGGGAETATAATGDTTARILGSVGILVGAVGVAYGVLARRRSA
ncbi:YcnI family protein [Streptomyces somaliensis DSM 40738]|uniref:YcnI family protein n=1 Tax=Streptomyces somaliensis (strain ATCC 33201 / DSM 40738 / JCM 12659 / KCTC 9044 / NCTC 11332 / NRRL B-12077 / IP 733) TaxID=1134445 RepID=A0AA44DH28_STRE0|nr:YcnI family protein [Streptomyces somaliensis]MCQ0024677.1 YcnI family protein [Streptomyces somaliensis DSM 40738]NKY16394.1 YcnI family protein [Streptomyces somaliensis DSM 40738]